MQLNDKSESFNALRIEYNTDAAYPYAKISTKKQKKLQPHDGIGAILI